MTPHSLTSLRSIAATGADTIIDVRAPSEFAEDHVPGAINLPVLSDAERAEVGTIYKQHSPFLARKVGAALVARNAAAHLQGPLAEYDGAWQPLVYCWRGGQRSGAFATILDQVGWRVHLIKGGYRSYRGLVNSYLYEGTLPHRITLLDGGTGTGKTALLHHLRDAGAQVIDLEELAAHRGSLFGAVSEEQPAQKMFESRLAAALDALDPERMTWIESESSRVGDRIIPPALWSAMCAAPRVEISAPLDARAGFLGDAYPDLVADRDRLVARIDDLRPYHAAAVIEDWQQRAAAGDWRTVARALMEVHYDPRYAKSQARAKITPERIALDALDPGTLAATARTLAGRFN